MDFSKAKELLAMQQEMGKIKKQLWNTHIEAESDGLVITIDGEMNIVSVDIEDESLIGDKKRILAAVKEAGNKGIKKSQQIASEQMQTVAKQMGLDLPGGMGM